MALEMKFRTKLLLSVSSFILAAAAAAVYMTVAQPSRIKKKVEQVHQDFITLSRACACVGLDNCGINYPVDTARRRLSDKTIPLTFEWDKSDDPRNERENRPTLTTPVAYMKQTPRDPFKANGGYYDYCTKDKGIRFYGILHSPGPDGVNDVDLDAVRAKIDEQLGRRPVAYGQGMHYPFTPVERGWIREMLKPALYDPTNGATSRGDLVAVMEMNKITFSSWGMEQEWAKAPVPEAGEPYAPVVAVASWWKPGEPLPKATTPDAEKWAEMVVHQPYWFARLMGQAGVYAELVVEPVGGRPGKFTCQFDEARVDGLRNHLSQFSTFFQTPRALNAEELKRLEVWRAEDAAWWQAVEDPVFFSDFGPGETRGVTVNDFYSLLVLYGKSKLLCAARVAATGDRQLASRHIAGVTNLLQNLNAMWLGKIPSGSLAENPYITRVHTELTRLCNALPPALRR